MCGNPATKNRVYDILFFLYNKKQTAGMRAADEQQKNKQQQNKQQKNKQQKNKQLTGKKEQGGIYGQTGRKQAGY